MTRVTFTGAALALPVVAAGTASALEGDGTYTVASGDTLSGIAEEQGVEGGWKELYDLNTAVIGDDPNLLQVGDELRLTSEQAVLPVEGGTRTAGFAASGDHWAEGHTGQDFAVPVGTRVEAALEGTVVSAGWGDSFGYEIVVKHGADGYTHYAHLSQIDVSEGESVGTGDRIGASGATGNVTGPHLHFEVRTSPEYGSAVDPVDWLREHGARI
ncbi:M23 family metallopeptidase [Streptomyces boluensis]|uniref:Peptidoglycan DD-metalloendopeptidase family protein n=1 Tax=Streptomyces boluensis TaxID=1775135 RepID=A0A964UY57_9ACTN|nr:LysM peptidoglycan-binding domain-containing M23 family metallopeptidase [Streptomyces boluensis]NBE56877.1 peptidoglycan DD-metalloendopeptidase family protein [Streptomyces boluensis]